MNCPEYTGCDEFPECGHVASALSRAVDADLSEFVPLLDENGWPTNIPPYGTPIIAKLGQTVIHGTIGASQGGKYIDVDLLTRDGEVAEDEPFLQGYTLWIPSGWTFEIGVSE